MTQVADDIAEILSPVIGKGMATSAVYIQCKKLGIAPENLSEENIEEFSAHFKKVIQIFAGDPIADEMVMKIKKIKK